MIAPTSSERLVEPVFAILVDASNIFQVSVADVQAPGHCHAFARVRFATAWVARLMTDCSLPTIGAALHRDHSTVVHALKRAEQLRGRDPEFQARTNRLLTLTEQRTRP